MNYSYIAFACVVLAGCALALHLPDQKDQDNKPIDSKQIKNATVAFYNNGTFIYLIEAPCTAYMGGSGGSQQQRGGSQQGGAHDEEEEEDDDEESSGSQSPQQQQRQRQQQQQRQRQRQQQQQRGGRSSQSSHHEYDEEELQKAHEGTECECQCKNQEGQQLENVITVHMGSKSGSSNGSSQQGGRSQQQRKQQQQQQQQQQRQRQQQQRGGSSSSQHGSDDEDKPELVYPPTPRAGQTCVFFAKGEWESNDDELIDAIGPDHKAQGEPEEEVLEKCTIKFKSGGGSQQQSGQQGGQQVQIQCVDNHGEQDQYTARVVSGEIKISPQQKQQSKQSKQSKSRSQ